MIGVRDSIGILLVHHAASETAIFLLELVDFVFVALLGSPRLLVLGDFNIHAEAKVAELALEFLETMASLDMSQNVNGHTHMGITC